MFLVKPAIAALTLLTLALFPYAVHAQSSPGFQDSHIICADSTSPVCSDTTNPGLNQAFMSKQDSVSGLVADGVTDNTTVFQALLTPAGTNGGSVNLPCGNFAIKSATSLVIAAGKNVTIQGQGMCTTLAFQGTAATAVTLGDVFSSIRWGHMRVTTDGAGTYAGLTAFMPSNPVPLGGVQHVFEEIQFIGDTYTTINPPSHWWSTALSITGPSFVSIDNVTVIGGTGRSGTGVLIQGVAASGAVGVIYNFKNFATTYTNIGIDYGTLLQGVSVVSSNFTSGNYGIKVNPAGIGPSQLEVVNSQFGDNTTAGISVGANINAVHVSNSLFELDTGQIGIDGTGASANYVGNSFLDPSSLPSGRGIGINLSTAGGYGTITSNTFTSLRYGIQANAGSTYAELVVSNNVHIAFGTMYNITGGTNIFINETQPVPVNNLPTCNSTIQGSMFTVDDNNTTVSYRGAVTTGGSNWGRVLCLPSGSWVQN